MGINISNIVESLDADGSSKVQVGNNTTYIYNSERDQDEKKKLLQALRSTDPRHDKTNIEQTNNDLLKEAYIWILENPEFLAWRQGTDRCRLLWIRGDAGKGKTMLLCGIIDELRPSTRLGNEDSSTSLSFFFCQATNSELNSSTAVLRGLIYLLVDQQPHLLSHLRANVHWDSRVAMEDLFRKIVADPTLGETYMIVDALDECLEDLEFLLRIICDTVSRIKWIVSSRNRREVADGLAESSSKLALSLELNEESITQAVKVFINHRTRDLAEKKQLKPEVAQEVHQHLTEHANDTFLWVGLVCRRLARCKAWEIRKQLDDLPEGLDELYARSMEQIRDSDSCDSYIRLLALVSTVFRPLNLSELKAMAQLNLDEKRLLEFIGECGSFLTTRGTTVVFVHQSAKDFLEEESRKFLFQSGLAQHHYALFQRCLDVLGVLKKDMYELEYPGVSLDAAIRHRPKSDPLDSLSYALVFWANHLGEAYRLYTGDDAESEMPFAETVYNFFCTRFLFWLEALSLSHNISVAGKSLLSLKNLLAVCLSPKLPEQSNQLSKEDYFRLKMPFAKTVHKKFRKALSSLKSLLAHGTSEPGLPELIEDALRFLLLFGPVIETYPLQTYTSGLLFSPQNSIIRNLFKESTPSFIKRGPKVDDDWSPILGVFDNSPGSEISTMIFSTMSDMVVMTTSDSQLLMWNVNNGYVHRDSRYNHAKWLRPSPDLQLLAFITTQNVLEVCELNSRKVLWTVKLSSPFVLAMEFAPDSQWLAVCHDYNLYLYDREGKLCQSWALGEDLTGSESYDLSYSSKSDLLLCVTPKTHDGIAVFDMRTGRRYKFPGYFTGGSFSITAVRHRRLQTILNAKFLPDSDLVMFTNEYGGMFLWDVSNMRCKDWLRDRRIVYCFAYSHAEVWMVMTTHSEIVLVDRNGRIVLQRFYFPTYGSDCIGVQVSYDNKKIAVHSDYTVWLLDVQIDQSKLPKKRKPCILDDRVTIAHIDATTIEVENPITEVTSTLDMRNTAGGHIKLMAISPDGRLFAYSDWSKGPGLIRLWDLEKNTLLFRFEVSQHVRDIAISPIMTDENQWLAVRIRSELILWNVSTAQFHLSITSPDKLKRSCHQAFFRGTWIGVIWISRPHGGLFVRYDIKTGHQLPRMDFTIRHPYLSSSLSPNGKWLVSYLPERSSILLSDIEAGVPCAVIDIYTKGFSFIDDSALRTQEGVLSFDYILDNLINKSETSKSQIRGMDGQVAQELPVITPSITKYGYSANSEWITLDGRPLIWLPQQYRIGKWGSVSIGYQHVISKYTGGIYFIVFKDDAVDVLRQAISKYSKEDLEIGSV